MEQQRRARLVSRHLLGGGATSALEATRSVVALHATDPATVYLSVMARAAGLDMAAVDDELYDQRRLVRMMAMRRTLFVVPQELVPVVHHAASLDVAATIAAIKETGSQIVVNLGTAFVNMSVLEACLETGAAYIDTAIHEDPDAVCEDPPWYANHEWKRADRCAERGVTAILGVG